MNQKILLCTYSRFPGKSAMATRAEEFLHIFQLHDDVVTLITLGKTADNFLGKVKCIDFQGNNKNKALLPLHYHQKIKKLLRETTFDVIVECGSIPLMSSIFLKDYCRRNHSLYVADVVDWYSLSECKRGVFSYFYWKETYKLKHLYCKGTKVLAISKYLESYFKHQGASVLYYPFTMRKEYFSKKGNLQSDVINFMYAGNPGKRDMLFPFFEAMSMLPMPSLRRIRFYLFGVNETYIQQFAESNKIGYEKIKPYIVLKGRVSRNEILSFYHQIHFTVLLRDASKRFAQAGFPTKVPESLFSSTPVFCNLSSNIGDFLKHKYNSILVENTTAEACLKGLNEVLYLTNSDLEKLSTHSFHTAANVLDSSLYASDVYKFITK